MIILGCLLTCRGIHAQRIVWEGKVWDEERNVPIPSVSISTLQKDSLYIDFTVSNDDGSFKIDGTPPAAFYLSFSCMGYHTRIIPIRSFVQGGTILLSPQTFKIKEVTVRSNRIRQTGDTIIYEVSGFKMPQDRSIGDVLKKMPGLEVSDNGQVKYQGKAISKLYIEGSDLLESKYGLAVRNVRAQDVKSVEVLENHEAVKALKGVRFNEAAALNLTLKDEAKARYIGVGDAGIGAGFTPLLWNARLMGMKFGKKQQSFSIYKSNNTGTDVSDELYSLATDPFAKADLNYSPGLLHPLNAGRPDLDEGRYLQNSSHLLSLNRLWKQDDKRQWRFQASYINNRIKGNADYRTGYFYGKDNYFDVQESYRTKGTEHHVDGELSFEQNTDSLHLKNVLNYKGGFDTYDAQIDNHPGLRHLHLRAPRQSVTNRFSLIRKSSAKVFQFYSFNQWINHPQELHNRPDAPDTLFTRPYKRLEQEAGLSTFLSQTFSSFRFRVFGFYIGAEAGVKLQSDRVDSELGWIADKGYISLPDSFRNDFNYFRSLAYIEPNISFTRTQGRLSASLKLNSGWLYRKHSPAFVFQPHLQLNFKASPKWEIGGSANRNFLEDDVRTLYPGYIMNGYRTFQAFDPDYTSRYSDAYTLSSTFKNPMKGIFLSLRGGFIRTEEEYADLLRFDGIISYTDRIPFKHTSRNKFIQAKIGQSFSFWNTRLSFEAVYRNYDDLFLLPEETRYRTRQIQASGNVILQPLPILSFEYDLRFESAQTKAKQTGERQSIRETRQLLEASLYPTPAWLFKFSHSFHRNSITGNPTSYFMDLHILYRFGKEMELNLSAHNLLGKTKHRFRTINTYYYTQQNYVLRGREICLTYSFSF